MADTSPADDVQALRAALVQVLHTAPFDDMLWSEMLAALQLVMHDIQLTVAAYGSFNNAPVPAPPDPPAR